MEIFDKKFVYFMWDDELEGKKVFIADYIDDLCDYVEKGNESNLCEVKRNDYADAPFRTDDIYTWRFAYYDENYEVKKAFKEGKQIQYRVKGFVDWEDYTNQNPCWDDKDREWRVKLDEEKWIAYLAREIDGSCYLSACTESYWKDVQKEFGAKTKLFIGAHDEVSKWFELRQKFAKVIKAWEDGKEIQVKAFTGLWYSASNPTWEVDTEYRVKPEEKEETKDKDKMNPIQGKKMCRYNLNLGDWDELKEMAIKMFKGIATLNERFAKKISEGEFVTQDDWKEMNGLWQTFNYINDDKKFCKEDLHHLFTDDLDEEFVEIEAEETKEKKHYRPYINSVEMIADFIARFKADCPPYEEPSIWVKNKVTDARHLVTSFVPNSSDGSYVVLFDYTCDLDELFNEYTYLDGSPCGMEVKE